jgi:hypothetical protein
MLEIIFIVQLFHNINVVVPTTFESILVKRKRRKNRLVKTVTLVLLFVRGCGTKM